MPGWSASPAEPEAALAYAAHLTAVMVKEAAGSDGLAHLLSDRRLNAVLIGPGIGVGEATRAKVLAVAGRAAGGGPGRGCDHQLRRKLAASCWRRSTSTAF